MALAFVNAYYAASAAAISGITVTAGNLIVVGISYGGSFANGGCTDNNSGGSNTYPALNTTCPAYDDVSINGYYAVANTTGTLTVTTTNTNTGYQGMIVLVFSGNATSNVLDGTPVLGTVEGSTTTSHASASSTTTNANDLLVCFWGQGYAGMSSPFWTENGQSFTNEQANEFWASSYRIVSSTGSYHDAQTSQTATYAGSLLAAFQAAGGTTYQPYWMMGILD